MEMDMDRERERARERYNRMLQRRCLSPTRSRSRSPHPCQYIHRARPSTPPSLPAVSPDMEPIFQMSPIPMHCLPPPPPDRAPVNVMALPNSRSRLRSKSTRTAPAIPLLYTFPRPNNSNSNSNSNSHSKHFPSVKKPFSLVSQNQTEDSSSSELEFQMAPPTLFLDLSPTPPHPPPSRLPTDKHIRIAHIDEVEGAQKKSRVPTSPKSHNPPKPFLPDLTISRARSTSLSSPTTPTPLRRMPSLPIPIPYHSPRQQDTGMFEDDQVSVSDAELAPHGITTRKSPCNGDIDTEENTNPCEQQIRHDPLLQSNYLPLRLPFSPLPDPSPSPSLELCPIRCSNPNPASYSDNSPPIYPPSRSSSLSPNVGMRSDINLTRMHNYSPLPLHTVTFMPQSVPIDICTDQHEDQSSTYPQKPHERTQMRKRRSKELDEAEYFENPSDDPNEKEFVSENQKTSSSPNLAFVPQFNSPEPVFPAFSITYNSDHGFGFGLGDGITHSHFQSDTTDDTSELTPSEQAVLSDELPIPTTEMNPWVSLFNTNSDLNLNSVPTTMSEQESDIPVLDKEQLHDKGLEKSYNHRNGKVDLSVFNPPIPTFGGGSLSSDDGSNSDSDSSRRSPSLTPSPPFPFLSFPIPVFDPEHPHTAVVGVATVPIPIPPSSVMLDSDSDLGLLALNSTSSEALPYLENRTGNGTGGDMSFRSSVYGGLCDHDRESKVGEYRQVHRSDVLKNLKNSRGSLTSPPPAEPFSPPLHSPPAPPVSQLAKSPSPPPLTLSQRSDRTNQIQEKREKEKEREKGAYRLLKKIVGIGRV